MRFLQLDFADIDFPEAWSFFEGVSLPKTSNVPALSNMESRRFIFKSCALQEWFMAIVVQTLVRSLFLPTYMFGHAAGRSCSHLFVMFYG